MHPQFAGNVLGFHALVQPLLDPKPENPSLKDIGYVLGVQPFDCTPFYNASLDFADKTVKNFNFLFSGAIFMLDSFVNENLFNQSI